MKKRLLMVALAVGAILPTMASGVENLADLARVYDLDEVVVVSQAKEFYRLRQQPVSSTVLTSNETKVSHLPFYRLSRIIKHCNILIDNLLTSRK